MKSLLTAIAKFIGLYKLCLVECSVCGGSGFSGYGTGYDAVCGNCGGLKFILKMRWLWETYHEYRGKSK